MFSRLIRQIIRFFGNLTTSQPPWVKALVGALCVELAAESIIRALTAYLF